VQFLIIAEVWKQADSSENYREAGVASVVNYPKLHFCNIFYNGEISRGPQEKLSQAVCSAGLVYVIVTYMTTVFLRFDRGDRQDI